MTRQLTRRRLITDGGALAGAAALGTAIGPGSAAAQERGDDRPNGLLIVTPGIRADKIGHYGGDFDDASTYDTPNLDELARQSLRFENATPESVGGIPSRHALICGTRIFPYRDWRRTSGLAGQPGWNRLLPRTPIGTDVLSDAGIKPTWITDNPLFSSAGYRGVTPTIEADPGDFPRQGAPPREPLGADAARRDIERFLIPAIQRGAEATERAVRRAIDLLPKLKRDQPFFLAVDAFDPAEAYGPPRVYQRKTPIGLLAPERFDWVVEAEFDDAEVDRVREVYSDRMRFVDRLIGQLLDRVDSLNLENSTIVTYTSDAPTMLGEFDALGKGAPGAHLDGWFIPLMIRDPDGRRGGESTRYFASTHDILPTFFGMMDVVRPGRMKGNDLSVLLDEDDPFPRPGFVIGAVSNIVVGDRRWLMISNREGENRKLFDQEIDDDADWDDDDDRYDKGDNVIRGRPDQIDRMWPWVMAVAEGTLPEFGPDAAIRPLIRDDDEDDDGIDDRDEEAGNSERDLDATDEDFDVGGSEGNEESGRASEEEGLGRRPPVDGR